MALHSYVRLDDFKARGAANIGGSTDDARLLAIIEAVSDEVDRWCARHFYTEKSVKYFAGNGTIRYPLPWDVARVTSLKEDEAHSGSFTAWSSSAYFLWPYDARSTEDYDGARPYSRLEVNLKGTGNQDVFLAGQRRYELTGFFGFTERVRSVAALGANSSISASSTKVTVTGSTKISVGDTLLVNSEQMYVTAVPNSSEIGVVRGVNGTTGSTGHTSSDTVYRYVYPQAVVEATLMQTARLWMRRERGYADNAVGLQESGQAGPTVTGMDADVKALLGHYRRAWA